MNVRTQRRAMAATSAANISEYVERAGLEDGVAENFATT